MSGQQVPWAPGRRALVLTSYGWRECEGAQGGRQHQWTWMCPSTNWMGEPSKLMVFESEWDGKQLLTALLPSQCPRCFEVGTHADGCMVATNLARGMSAFWAPWVMETPPPVHVDRASVFQVHADRLEPMSNGVNPGWEPQWFVMGRSFADDDPDPSALGWLVLGPEGPTLAPWGIS